MDEKPKLTWTEKFAMKKIRNALKRAREKKGEKLKEKTKKELITMIMTATQIFEITDDETGREITPSSLNKRKVDQLKELLERIITDMEKIV